jgi:hypothetical protein
VRGTLENGRLDDRRVRSTAPGLRQRAQDATLTRPPPATEHARRAAVPALRAAGASQAPPAFHGASLARVRHAAAVR